jgi:hypothetical protein
MRSIAAPWVDTGRVVTREGVIVWFRRGRWLFLLLVIIAVAIPLQFLEPDREWRSNTTEPVETAVSGTSPVINITVSATTPNYHSSN